MRKFLISLLSILCYLDVFGQEVYISFRSDTNLAKRDCDVYFSGLKVGVSVHRIRVPTNGFYSLKCPLNQSFEVVLDCWPSRIVLDKIYPKCGDSIIVNLDKRTFVIAKQ